MSIRQRLAWAVTKHQYRTPFISDVPSNDVLFNVMYGTWRKVRNYHSVRRSFRRHSIVVNGYPTELRVDPTSTCNLRCPLCPTGTGEVDRVAGLMPLETFQTILDRFGDFLFYIHLWAWGEPILHKDLARMIAMAEDRRVGTEVSTNLSIELSDKWIDEVIRAGLTWLIVSNDAATAETYEKYRVGGEFELVMSNMRRIAERKRALRSLTPFVEWQWVPFKHNEAEIARAWKLARDLRIDGLRFKPTRVDKTQYLTFKGSIPDAMYDWVPDEPRLRHLVEHEHDSFLDSHCPFLWRSLTLHHDGAIAPCCETYKTKDDFGRLSDDFATLWNGQRYRDARRIALGIDLKPEDERLPCYGCKVFAKPHRNGFQAKLPRPKCQRL